MSFYLILYRCSHETSVWPITTVSGKLTNYQTNHPSYSFIYHSIHFFPSVHPHNQFINVSSLKLNDLIRVKYSWQMGFTSVPHTFLCRKYGKSGNFSIHCIFNWISGKNIQKMQLWVTLDSASEYCRFLRLTFLYENIFYITFYSCEDKL